MIWSLTDSHWGSACLVLGGHVVAVLVSLLCLLASILHNALNRHCLDMWICGKQRTCCLAGIYMRWVSSASPPERESPLQSAEVIRELWHSRVTGWGFLITVQALTLAVDRGTADVPAVGARSGLEHCVPCCARAWAALVDSTP
jgi:hypothetical protein